MIHPIIDEYYNHSPSYARSSGFVVSKGLVSSGPGATAPPGATATRSLSPAKGEFTSVLGENGSLVPIADGRGRELNDRLQAVQQRVADVHIGA